MPRRIPSDKGIKKPLQQAIAVPQLQYLETIAAQWLFFKKKPPRMTFARA
jgi:hypothetical protein